MSKEISGEMTCGDGTLFQLVSAALPHSSSKMKNKEVIESKKEKLTKVTQICERHTS